MSILFYFFFWTVRLIKHQHWSMQGSSARKSWRSRHWIPASFLGAWNFKSYTWLLCIHNQFTIKPLHCGSEVGFPGRSTAHTSLSFVGGRACSVWSLEMERGDVAGLCMDSSDHGWCALSPLLVLVINYSEYSCLSVLGAGLPSTSLTVCFIYLLWVSSPFIPTPHLHSFIFTKGATILCLTYIFLFVYVLAAYVIFLVQYIYICIFLFFYPILCN